MPHFARREAKPASGVPDIRQNSASLWPRSALESEADRFARDANRADNWEALPDTRTSPTRRVADSGPLAGGTPLPDNLRGWFEPVLGHDFSRVRIHADGRAGETAGALSARAFALGSHVVFGTGHYAPHTPAGRHLLAHELAHVVQQQGGPPVLQRQPDETKPSPKEDPADKEIATRQAALKSMKNLKATERVGKSTADTVEALIESSAGLRPYIRDKVVKTSVGKGFTIYDFDVEFDSKLAKLDGVHAPNKAGSQRGATVAYGFYHRKTDSIHLRPDAQLGHALHEGIHKYSSVMLQRVLGIFLNEGITQKYADQVQAEQNLSGKARNAYDAQLAAAEVLAGWFSTDELAKAYFQGQGVTELATRVRQELAIESGELAKLAAGNDGQDLADKIVERKGKASRAKPPAADVHTAPAP